MDFASFFVMLYPVVPLAGLVGYIPQIVSLIKIQRAPQTLSINTWIIWTSAWLISLGYAVFELQDVMFAITSGMNAVGHLLVLGLTIYKKYRYRENVAENALEVIPLAIQS